MATVRERVGDGRVICALSGGVDSSVVAALLKRAVGERSTAIFVDNGVLRKDEAAQVRPQPARRAGHPGPRGRRPGAVPRASSPASRSPRRSGRPSAASSSTSSRTRRRRLEGVGFLAQGTLYPDVIESVSVKGPSAVIKTHHNVGGLPGGAGLRAGRAAALPVQGRGAPARPRAGAARADHRPPPLPGSGPRGAHPGRGHAPSGSPCSRRPTPSSCTSCARAAGTTR